MNHEDWKHAPAGGNAISRISRLSLLLVGFATILSINGTATAQPSIGNCVLGHIAGGFGPFDYRTERNVNLTTVEQYHFTPEVENRIKGNTGTIGSDLDYTLRAFPNHHRALIAMMRLGEKLKTPQPPGARFSVECWFERALYFRPDDDIARLIYATFLVKNGRKPEAIKQLEATAKAAGNNGFTHYNIGLIYLDIKDYDQALAQAHIAYGLGVTKPELREKLESTGKWKEPDKTPVKPPPEVATQGAEAANPNGERALDPNNSGNEK